MSNSGFRDSYYPLMNVLHAKGTFGSIDCKTFTRKSLKDRSEVIEMIRWIRGKDNDVVNIRLCEIAASRENIVHSFLKNAGAFFSPNGSFLCGNLPNRQAKVVNGHESGSNKLVESFVKVQGREYRRFSDFGKNIFQMRNVSLELRWDCIDAAIVDTSLLGLVTPVGGTKH